MAPPAHAPAPPARRRAQAAPLPPEIVAVIEALAEAMAREDYAAAYPDRESR